MGRFTYKDNNFLLDGENFVIRSGAIHYFRIPRFYWKDRLQKLKECGFNCVETYMPWNLHEEREGHFSFEGQLDIRYFLDLARDAGLLAIVRPGPYICAEWEGGGLPSWLLKYNGIILRSSEPTYFSKAKSYLKRVFEELNPYQIDNGGNIIMMQVENEYGSYGNDKKYMNMLYDLFVSSGITALLFTSDGADPYFINGGALEQCITCGNFGSDVKENMQKLSIYKPCQPLMCSEFWCGWFDCWHEKHHDRSVNDVINNIEQFLKCNYSFNFYMFCGGTNFGFMNGANMVGESYHAVTTSYDYNALLTESGDRTDAYYKVRELFAKYNIPLPEITSTDSEKANYENVKFTDYAFLEDNLKNIGHLKRSIDPLSMEKCNQNYGYMWYSTSIDEGVENLPLIIDNLSDRAIVYVDDKKAGVYERGRKNKQIYITTTKKSRLNILLENMGRINFGNFINDSKGIKYVRFFSVYGRRLMNWKNISLPMDNLGNLKYKRAKDSIEWKKTESPVFIKGHFYVDKCHDTFCLIKGATKGFVVINGFNIGRYYVNALPQKTLYVPESILKNGDNEIIIFESDKANNIKVKFVDKPIFVK